MRRVARPSPTRRTPVASGSRVPAWPTRRWPKSRRQRATTSWDVQPASLSTTTRPVALMQVRVLVPVQAAEKLFDPRSRRDGRVGLERQSRRALEGHLGPDETLQMGTPLLERIGGIGLQRGQVDRGRPHVGGRVDRGHRDHAEALVGVGQPLELLCDDLPQDLVHPQRARVRGGAPFHDDVTSSRSRAPQTSR